MYHILVIDDDPTTRLILKNNLTKQGHQVTVSQNGADGIAAAQAIKPALIICDWMMPGVDGLEVCRQVKHDRHLSATFFVLLTAKGELEDRVRGLDAGADEFLSKPIEQDELRARVQAGLRLYQLNRDIQEQKQLLEAEFREAAMYVRSLLPQPLETPIKIDFRFIPSSELGGDCFDFFWIDDRRLVMYLLDVSGHGLGAALPSISVLNLLRNANSSLWGSQQLAGIDYNRPCQVLALLNHGFQMTNQNDKYFTIWYGIYDRQDQTLTYASAGHPPALLIHSGENELPQVTELKTPGIPIGMFTDVDFAEATHTIPPGSCLYLFSDGIYEFQTHSGEQWGIEAFQTLLAQHQNSPSDLGQILAEIQSLTTPAALAVDDLSIVAVDFMDRTK
ncbi:SpoIIE family protein phosphatase [Candidatus Synechococcus calcipolaris G9]|uniref:SpoIIE family protein phosphatase n=1 Tax=Candidatus Synechococcus calcipolaris G9 TaxID=1497997 RepID=A0ABT6EVK1_9SYNE|nr:SpoIIE family protein phosphatase [Candidatus Synechococcus calcipolaris]MDG2989830.1 SpoIIE family protein phosphatase [Candidatus Synechococcus calcipolaris G9]